MTARRFHSLAAVGGDDDMFSDALMPPQLRVRLTPQCGRLQAVSVDTVIAAAASCMSAP